MKLYLERGGIQNDNNNVRQLIQDKVRHYEKVAAALIIDDSSTTTAERHS